MTRSSPEPGAGVPSADPVFEGLFGPFTITAADRREVLHYRLALLGLALGQLGLVLQAWLLGPRLLWPWLLPMLLGLGLALRWIHIYLIPLHRALQLLWLSGCLGFAALALQAGPGGMAEAVLENSRWIWAIGPFFAALAGVGFKEFFCFRRPEAIGVTLLLPLALLGHLSGLLAPAACGALLALQALLLLVLCLRKFPMPAAADIGDKSVFLQLHQQRQQAARRQPA
ncbi:MAG: DUF2301 domain-containing membrane protein [Cyanobium sp.]|jgi:uncharacterized integral membrane protein